MKRGLALAVLLNFQGISLWGVGLGAMTVEVAGGNEFVKPGDSWRFFRARTAPSAPAGAWKETDFPDSGWELGPGGFGYKYTAGIGTTLADMRYTYLSVFTRREFTVTPPIGDSTLELQIDYDDGFAAYLNGKLVAWRNLSKDPIAPDFDFNTPATLHDAGTPLKIALGKASDLLLEGKNVLAIEGHNVSQDSSDLALIPHLRLSSPAARDGAAWVVEAAVQTIRCSTSSPQAASLRVNGVPATADPAGGGWLAQLTLSPGANHLLAEALDGAGGVVDSGSADVLYLPAAQRLAGTLSGDTTLSTAAGGYFVDGDLVVPQGSTLRIEPGVTVYLKSAASITVSGALLAEGTEAQPIRLTRYGEGNRWKRLMFVEAAPSRLVRCIFEYADSEGAHQDYYTPGPRSYHEAVVLLASHVDIEGCVFRKLPDEGAAAEGDALAVISDDPVHPGASTANIRSCQFLSIGQGVHERYSYVLVEDCYFTGKRGDNDDVDLYGESTPPPLIRHNSFINPQHDDMINPTRCSAVITGNFLTGSDDHGIVLRDKGSPVVYNNVIQSCANGGIAVENTCNALLVNNTVINCGRGLRLFDLGRWDAPYYLAPGGGTATVINCVIWNCTQPITLADSSNTQITDRGSHLTIHHSDVQGGQAGVSVSGTASTVSWGAGNLNADPLFVNAAQADFRLKAGSPAIDAGTADKAPEVDRDGNPRPCGGGFDLGAYEQCQAGPLTFKRGDPNGDGQSDLSDAVAVLFHLFAVGTEPGCLKSADTNDDGSIKLSDAIGLLGYLFLQAEAPPLPFAQCGVDPTTDGLTCQSYAPCR